MFQKDGGKSGPAHTVIGPSVKVEGDLKGVGNLLIEGTVKGSLSTDQDVTIGDKAEVEADISANNASVAGKVEGAVSVNGHLDVKSTAKINGDISSQTLAVESGAQINGLVTMGKGAPQKSAPEPEQQPEE